MILPYTATAAAETLLATLDRAAAAHDRATLAVSGGRTPGPTVTALARMCDPFLRERLHLLWLDERAVPPGHAERNDGGILAAWRGGGALPAHVHPMPAEALDLQAAAATYAATLHRATGGRPLDACLLGFGEDGHVASLFPHHGALRELDPVLAVIDSPKPPARRLSLSLGPLVAAELRVVPVFGQAKGRILARARSGPDPALPCSLLPASTVWFLDDEALAGLEAPCA